jgi:hypothetical protein
MTTRRPLPPPQAAAMRRFIEAVCALSDDPGRTNVTRYLAASQALDDSRTAQESSLKRAA